MKTYRLMSVVRLFMLVVAIVATQAAPLLACVRYCELLLKLFEFNGEAQTL